MSKKEYREKKERWYHSHGDEEKELFELCMIFLLTMTGSFIWALLDMNNYRPHIILAFACLMVFLWFVIRRGDIVVMFRNLQALLNKSIESGYKQKTDTVILLCGVLAVISVLFVINLDLLSGSGVRIGAVAAFGLYTALIAVWNSFKKN